MLVTKTSGSQCFLNRLVQEQVQVNVNVNIETLYSQQTVNKPTIVNCALNLNV